MILKNNIRINNSDSLLDVTNNFISVVHHFTQDTVICAFPMTLKIENNY